MRCRLIMIQYGSASHKIRRPEELAVTGRVAFVKVDKALVAALSPF